MITATAHGENGEQIIVLGLSRENVKRLTAGKPIHMDRKTHVGLPENLVIMICFGETEEALVKELLPLIGTDTTILGTIPPRPNGEKS